MKVRRIIKKILKEDSAATAVATAKQAQQKIKSNLQKLDVVSIPDLDAINTIEQLSIEPFSISFIVQDPEDKQAEFNLPKVIKLSALAEVNKENKSFPLVLSLKQPNGEFFQSLVKDPTTGEKRKQNILPQLGFIPQDALTPNLPGTKNKVIALVASKSQSEGKMYNVVGDMAFKSLIVSKNQESEGGEEGEEGEDKENEEVEKEGELEKSKKLNKEQLYNDLTGFFKFIYNNRTFGVSSKKETTSNLKQESVYSIVNQIAENITIITEEDVVKEKTQQKSGVEAKIYITSIELGSKAKIRKGEDVRNYTDSVGGGDPSKWDGTIYKLPNLPGKGLNVKVDLNLYPENKLDTEQQKVFKEIISEIKAANFKDEAKIRRSAKDTNGTVFIVTFNIGSKEVALVCKTSKKAANLKYRTVIEIGPKPTGQEIFDKSTIAEIQITT